MRPARGAGRMPGRANPAQGNPNSMPQIRARSKFLVEGNSGPSQRYCSPAQNEH
jgi:hypothetical protein